MWGRTVIVVSLLGINISPLCFVKGLDYCICVIYSHNKMLRLFITVSYFVIVLMDMAIRSAVCMYVFIANDGNGNGIVCNAQKKRSQE